MLLSVIIVNYNVRYFLEQCLHSVQQAVADLEAEVIVVDNNSSDDSLAYLQPLFPSVQFIGLSGNIGFAKANNHALQHASGEYFLFLNPDTIVPENCFTRCISFLQEHPQAGALGIKMIDGAGKFLPESKRAFPSPLTSLYKLTGLSSIFPKSKIFGRYHLGQLDPHKTHEVEVLAGAFMMMPKKVLDITGGFDEMFFMYGEDIDLSYRVLKAGFRNHYFAGSSIIHFKGESTKKGSLNYVRIFYQAMILFVRKHYHGSGAIFYRALLNIAIVLRAMFSAFSRFLRNAGLPVLDVLITLLVLLGVMRFWYTYIKPEIVLIPWVAKLAFPVFSITFLLSGALSGLYDKSYKPRRAFSAMMIGMLVILALYSLLPEDYRFSRGIILVAGLLATFSILLVRWMLIKAGIIDSSGDEDDFRQTVVAGTAADFEEIARLLRHSGSEERLLGRLSVGQSNDDDMGVLERTQAVLKEIPFRELVFCFGPELGAERVIDFISHYPLLVRYKFHQAGSGSIVGSDSIHNAGEVFAPASHYHLSQPRYQRSKRVLDVLVGLLVLVTFPVQVFVQRNPLRSFSNAWMVLAGRRTWVSYIKPGKELPPLRCGVIATNGARFGAHLRESNELLHAMDQRYAAYYHWEADLRLLLKNFRNLGASPD